MADLKEERNNRASRVNAKTGYGTGIERRGWVKKQSGALFKYGKFVKQFCVLKNDVISWSDQEKQIPNYAFSMRKVIDIQNVSERFKGKPVIKLSTRERNFLIQLKDQQDFQEWLDALNRSRESAKPLPKNSRPPKSEVNN